MEWNVVLDDISKSTIEKALKVLSAIRRDMNLTGLETSDDLYEVFKDLEAITREQRNSSDYVGPDGRIYIQIGRKRDIKFKNLREREYGS